mgnify:CR=1 FL=1
MIINVHGGHNRIVPGASGYLDEVEQDRAVAARVMDKLRALGHTVYDCTDNAGRTQGQNLANIVKQCNAHKADLDVSIHLNSGGGTGTEVLVYSDAGTAASYAVKICAAISGLGYRNRGVKERKELYVLRHTKAPALLVECCFADSAADAQRFDADKMAAAIVRGITGQTVSQTSAAPAQQSGYRVCVTASTLNVRRDHSASSTVTTQVHKGEVYTIVDEYNNGGTMWGKLKSGAGWIALKYTQRV